MLSVESEDGCFLVLRERVGRGGIQECCNYILFYGKRLGGGGGVLGFFFERGKGLGMYLCFP